MAYIPYCTQTDIQNEIGAAAVSALTDDSPPATLRDCIREGSSRINEMIGLIYDPATLAATSDWIVMKARVICSYLLFECRGSPAPPGLAAKYEAAMKVMDRVRRGLQQIPDCAPLKANVPVLSNVRVRLDPFPRAVVEQNISTGNPTGYEVNRDVTEAGFDYSIALWPFIGLVALSATFLA